MNLESNSLHACAHVAGLLLETDTSHYASPTFLFDSYLPVYLVLLHTTLKCILGNMAKMFELETFV